MGGGVSSKWTMLDKGGFQKVSFGLDFFVEGPLMAEISQSQNIVASERKL